MSKWPFAIDDNNGDWTVDDILSHVRAELERSWNWGFEGGSPAADALLRQVSVDAAMVVVQESVDYFQNKRSYGGVGFTFEPGAEPTFIMWPVGNLESLAVTVDLEAVMTRHDVEVHEREQMTDMAACLRRIADRYEQAAGETDWAAVEASLEGVARPFADGAVRAAGPFDAFTAEVGKAVAKGFADMPAPKS